MRGGESAEVIAAETGWPVDKVLRYAEPLLAERAFVAEKAQTVEIRRSGGGATLLEAAHASIATDPGAGEISWDAWRRQDGRWIVTADYADSSGDHRASWTYDHAGRNIHPLDDEARTLMGARPMVVPDDEVDIAEALDLVSDIPVVREEAVEEIESRPHLVAVPDSQDDETVGQGSPDQDEAQSGDGAQAEVEEPPALFDQPTVTLPHPSAGSTSEAESEPTPEAKPKPKSRRKAPAKAPAKTSDSGAEPTPEKTPSKPARKPRTRKGRASVPSWDEILFGATKSDD